MVDAEASCLKCNFGNKICDCTQCDGDGTILMPNDCRQCNGSGVFQHYLKCRTCRGYGDGRFICPKCNDGIVWNEYDGCNEICVNCSGNWNRTDCPSCNATGNYLWEKRDSCNRCGGLGQQNEMCNKERRSFVITKETFYHEIQKSIFFHKVINLQKSKNPKIHKSINP